MTSEQILQTVRGKLAQVSQLAAQFAQVESELRDSFEQLQSLHAQEIDGLHEVCRQNGVSIPHKPRASASWATMPNQQTGSSRTHHNTFDASGKRSFIPPPPSGKQSLPRPNGFHGRSQSSNTPTQTNTIPTANPMIVNDSTSNHNNTSLNNASRSYNSNINTNTNNTSTNTSDDDNKNNHGFAPPPPTSPPPSLPNNGNNNVSNSFGFGVTPKSVKSNKKVTTLPSDGLDEKTFYKKYWIEAGKIGEGSFARVRRITRKEDKKVFALKMIKKKGKSSSDIAAFQKEILVLQECEHKNIVRLLDWCDTRKRIYMVVEFCDGGDVFERVLQFKKFNEASAAHVVAQVASGLQHCHSKGFVHRDLKPDNLMYLTKDENSEIKIIDFGLAAIVTDGQSCTTPCGTAHYAAPEVLGNQAYDQSADMWSLGVIIYTLLCGFPPFFDANNNMKNLYSMIKKGKWSFPSPFWDDISNEAKDLISKLLQKNPKQRLTATQVMQHEWVSNASNTDKELSENYFDKMQSWQSTRHATEMALQDNNNNNNGNGNDANNSNDNVDLYKQNTDNGNNGKKYM